MGDTDFGETGSCFLEKLALTVRAMFSKSLIQSFVDGLGCVSSLLLDLRPDYGGSNEDNRLPWWHLSTMRETRVPSLCWEDPLEKEMAIHSRTIAWKIPWTEEPDRLQSTGLQRVGHN